MFHLAARGYYNDLQLMWQQQQDVPCAEHTGKQKKTFRIEAVYLPQPHDSDMSDNSAITATHLRGTLSSSVLQVDACWLPSAVLAIGCRAQHV